MIQVHYRDIPDYESWPTCVTDVGDISADDSRACIYRERNSHRGISGCSHVRRLIAKQVNQAFLKEISEMKGLEYLEMEIVTAEEFGVIRGLSNLKTLKIDSPRKASDFSPLLELPSLTKLFVQNAKQLSSLEPFSDAHNLTSLGIEGGMYTPQRIPSLKPLVGLTSLEALFLTNVRLEDKDLSYLSQIPNLRVLECARFAPMASFATLRKLMPSLECRWCDEYDIEKP